MPERAVIPARSTLVSAEETNTRLGHENLGFLSESHGFLPRTPPLRQLPATYQVWDETNARLPELYRNLALRKALAAMPLLSADEEHLPDHYLLRASAMLSAFAHAYYYIEPDRPAIPESILRPWEQIACRLNHPAPHLSFIDVFLYNWQWIDPTAPDPMRVDNLKPLVSIWDNEAERIFGMTMVEMVAQSAPMLGAVIRAQEAVQRDDADALQVELAQIAESLNHITYRSLQTINLNPYSDHYVDPVVWAKTVAPIAVPIREGSVGPSGAGAPMVQLLDAFFRRSHYDSQVGAETLHLRRWQPKHWNEFYNAVTHISVPDYVKRKANKTLSGIFHDTLQAFVGETGLIGRHRLKAYGFLETAFKVGRTVTIAHFSGQLKDRGWDLATDGLEQTRLERFTHLPPESYHHVPVKAITAIGAAEVHQVKQIVFDVTGSGISYQPGDRCALLPENSDDLVERTLRALRARGDEPIQLTANWRAAVSVRVGYDGTHTLTLSTLLKFGRIRPVDRNVAKMLYAITYNETLKRIIEARAEDQWELWDLLNLLSSAGFNPRTLWKVPPGDRQSICRIVPPETFRMYSISSVLESSGQKGELQLTVSQLGYLTKRTAVSQPASRHGTASTFLHGASASAATPQHVAMRIVHPPRFSLPHDPSRPIVMFAGGTGLAPFRGFIQARATQSGAGDNWLFVGARTPADFYYQQEIAQLVAQGRLSVRVAFSQDDREAQVVLEGDGGRFVFEPGRRHRIGEEMLREDNARLLWDLLCSRQEGGCGAYVYVCGRTGFAQGVMHALKAVVQRFSEGDEQLKAQAARRLLYRLVAQDRYMQDIFTTYTGAQIEHKREIDASEVLLHNSAEEGYWMIIDGRVYDVTEFMHLHPGGFKILLDFAGMDATQPYQKVRHHANPEVDSLLGMYEIGKVRRLNFGATWGTALGRAGLHFVTLEDGYRVWIRFLSLVVEIENALHNEFSLRHEALTCDETRTAFSLSPFKLQQLICAHQRFVNQFVLEAFGEPLEYLWAIISGLCAHNADVRWIKAATAAVQRSQAAMVVEHLSEDMLGELRTLCQADTPPDLSALQCLSDRCALVEREDKRFMRELRLGLRTGLHVFESYERNTISHGSAPVLAAVKQIPRLLEEYYRRVCAGVQAAG